MELDRPVEDVHEIFRGEFETTGVDDDIGDEAAYEADVGTNEGGALFADNIQLQTTPKGKGSSVQATVSTPAVGMTYESWEQIDLHFRCYAKQHGFAVCRVGSGVRQRNGVITKVKRNVIWKCENWGENKSDSNQVAINVPEVNVPNTRSRAAKKKADDNAVQKRQSSAGYEGVRVAEGKSKKCNCPVMLYANSSVDGSVWTIKKVILQHEGHEPTPSKSRSISAYRKEEWNPAIRRRLFNDLESGIKLPQIHRGMARERGGIENFALTQRDMRNEVTKKRNKDMEGGDAAAMYRYLRRMAEDNDLFFYEYRLDEFQRLKDVMWVDARSRAAFEYFGDVVCFDTTYITNEFELPFANFVGVNHHGQTILLGCALLAHEDSESFEWLFTTWLRCMGKAPDGILTDQDAAMKKALANAMPDVRHRWCLWHILKKFYTKLGSYEHYEKLSEALQNAIYDCLTPEEFEANWTSIVNKYNLSCDDWLEGLFLQREMWVPAYMRHMFWAGMRTTQRSESINSFFDGYVKRKTRLYEFVQQYVNAMESRVNDEKTADDDCARYTPHTVTNFKLEKTFRKIYTNGKFSEVQIECMKTIYVRPVQIDRVDDRLVDITLTDRVYVLNKKNRKEYATDKRRQYKVTFDTETKEASCVCKMFDSKGILCRHVIAVYDSYAVSDIPPKYILDRWRKDIKRKHTQIKVAHYDPTKTQDVKRFDRLNVAFDPLAIAACTDEEDVQIVIDMIYKASRLIEERRAKTKSTAEGDNIIQTPSSVGNGNMSGHSLEPVPPAIPSTPSHCIVGGTTEQQDSASEPHTPCISSPTAPHIYDPPTKKKPPNRPREKRFLSCLEKQPKNPRKRGKAAKESSSGESENQDFAHCVDYQLAPPPMLVQQAPVPLRPRPQPPAYQPPQSPAFHQVQPSAFQPVHSPAYGCPPADLYRCQQHLAYFNHGGHSYQIQYQGFRVPPPASHARSVGGVGSGHVNSLGYVTGSYAPYGEIQPWYGREGMGNFSTSSGPQSNGDTASTQCGSTT